MAGQALEKGAFLLGGDAGNGRPGNGPAMARRAPWWGDRAVGQWRVRELGSEEMLQMEIVTKFSEKYPEKRGRLIS